MSNTVIRKRRGITSDMSTLVGDKGEVFIDITSNTLVVHDGSTAGGWPLAHAVHSHANATTLTSGFMSTDDKTKLDLLSVLGGVQTILTEGGPIMDGNVASPPRNTINFNTDFYLTDNQTDLRTEIAISSTFREEMKNDMIAFMVALG